MRLTSQQRESERQSLGRSKGEGDTGMVAFASLGESRVEDLKATGSPRLRADAPSRIVGGGVLAECQLPDLPAFSKKSFAPVMSPFMQAS